MDKRIVRTRQSLQEALLSLLRDKPFEAIDIQEITDCANTARVTFYRHYGTKEELLLDTIARIYQDLRSELAVLSVEQVLDFQQPPAVLTLFRFLEQDRPLHRKIFTGTLSALIQMRIRHYMVEHIVHIFSQSPRHADLPIVLIANQVASTTIGNVMWWLADDLPYSSEYMARLTHWMAFTGALTLFGHGHELVLPPPESWRLSE